MPKRDIATQHGDIDSDSLCTPPKILDPIYELYRGPIGTDPCSNPHSIVKALQSFHSHGLALPWSYRGKPADGYQNHPYSTNEPWVKKMLQEMRAEHLNEHLVLCMSATGTYWWQDMMMLPRLNPRVMMIERIKFLGPNGKPMRDTARFDAALVFYPRRKAQVARFDKLFSHVARWTTWGR